MVEKGPLRAAIITFCKQNHIEQGLPPCDNLLPNGKCLRTQTAGVDIQELVVKSRGSCLYAEIDGWSGIMTFDRGFVPEKT